MLNGSSLSARRPSVVLGFNNEGNLIKNNEKKNMKNNSSSESFKGMFRSKTRQVVTKMSSVKQESSSREKKIRSPMPYNSKNRNTRVNRPTTFHLRNKANPASTLTRLTRMFTSKEDKSDKKNIKDVSDTISKLERKETVASIEDFFQFRDETTDFCFDNESFRKKRPESFVEVTENDKKLEKQPKIDEDEVNLELLVDFYEKVSPLRKDNEARAKELIKNYQIGNIAVALQSKYGEYPKAWKNEYQKVVQNMI